MPRRPACHCEHLAAIIFAAKLRRALDSRYSRGVSCETRCGAVDITGILSMRFREQQCTEPSGGIAIWRLILVGRSLSQRPGAPMRVDRSADARKSPQQWSDKLLQTPRVSGGAGTWIVLGALLV